MFQLSLSDSGIELSPELYDKVCNALNDDYQCVRESALSLIKVSSPLCLVLSI